VPAKLTPEPTKHEARKRRANERHAVGCYKELGRGHILRCAVDQMVIRAPNLNGDITLDLVDNRLHDAIRRVRMCRSKKGSAYG
jgi:hypothetical protein